MLDFEDVRELIGMAGKVKHDFCSKPKTGGHEDYGDRRDHSYDLLVFLSFFGVKLAG
jgi:hypothetical protein